MDFCSVADVKTFLGIASDAIVNEAQIEQAIKEASAVIQNYCNQEIGASSSKTFLMDGRGTDKLFLPELPVVQIESVKVDDVALDSTQYALAENGILRRKGGVWPEGARNIEVVYSYGYSAIPADIKGVCYRSAARVYQAQLKANRTDFVDDVKSVSVGDYSIGFGSSGERGESSGNVSAARVLLNSEKEILNKYRSKRL